MPSDYVAIITFLKRDPLLVQLLYHIPSAYNSVHVSGPDYGIEISL